MPILFGVVLLDLIGFGIVIPILPFLSPQLGADELDIALIIVTYAACAGVSAPFWGKASDRYGRKPIIMVCLAGGALAYAGLGLATQLWMIYLCRAFAGLMAGNFGVASAMMADITPPEQRARGMGLIGAAFGLGMVLGPFLGAVSAGRDGSFTLPCLIAGMMSLLAIVVAALYLEESLPHGRRNRAASERPDGLSVLSLLRQQRLLLFGLQYVLHSACVSSVTYLFPLWVGSELAWGAQKVGVVFGFLGVIMVILQGGAMVILVRVLGEWRLLQLSIGGFFIGLTLAALASSTLTMTGAFYLALAGATLCIPLLNTIVSLRTTKTFRGRVLGTMSSASSLGRVIGPTLTGLSLPVIGYRGAWVALAMIVFLYLGWAIRESFLNSQPQPEEI